MQFCIGRIDWLLPTIHIHRLRWGAGSRRHRGRQPRVAPFVVTTVAALGLLLAGAVPTSAAASDFTWSGAAPAGMAGWSNTANWAGGTAPSGSIGTLSFPALTSAACTAQPPTGTCYTSTNDVSGLAVNAISIDDGSPYLVSGNEVTLGSGGLSASTTTSSPGEAPGIHIPIKLGAAQTWTIDGNNKGGQLWFGGTVTGTSNALTINLTNGAFLTFAGDVEAGPTTVTGTSEGHGGLMLQGGFLGHGGSGGLNGTDGNAVSVSGVNVGFSRSTSIGPLTISNGGGIMTPAGMNGTLSVNGSVTFDSTSSFSPTINQASTVMWHGYSQVSASGAVNLAGAHLSLSGVEFPEGGGARCPKLPVGEVDTLVTTTGSLSGTFQGVPGGTTVQITCPEGSGTPPSVRINYTAQTVTATVVPGSAAPANTSAPSITGTPAVGQTLTCSQGSWSGNPAPTLADQWQRDGTAIAGATGSTYVVQAADEGHSLTCVVTASNATGQASAASAAVAIPAAGPPVGNGGSTTTGGGGSTTTGSGSVELVIHDGSLTARHGTVALTLRCLGSGPCKGTVTLTVIVGGPPAKKHGHHHHLTVTVIGSAAFSIPGGTTGTVTIHPNAHGRRLLGKAHPGLRWHAGLAISGTAAGQAITQHRVIWLVVPLAGHSKGRHIGHRRAT